MSDQDTQVHPAYHPSGNPDPAATTYLGAVQDRADLGGTEGETHVPGVSGGDRVHRQPASFVGGGRQGGHLVRLDRRAHLEALLESNDRRRVMKV
jgi:hypothetical protein